MRTQSYHPKGKAVKTARIWPVLPANADSRPRRKSAMKSNLQSRFGWSGLAVATLITAVTSQAAMAESAQDLAKAAQNPIANMISLPLQNNTGFKVGPEEGTANTLNIQPVWPVKINDDWNLITRTIIPLVSKPPTVSGGDRETGLGDISLTGFFSPNDSGDWIWGAGPIALIPSATNDNLGSDKWGLGASLIVLTMPGNWVVGSLFSNVWSVGGSGEQDINLFTWQYFINYNIPDSNGWYLTSAPIITANWEADSGNQWTVPIGGGAGKIFKVGKQALNAQAQAFYNVEKPDLAGDWQLRLQLQFLFPK